MNETLEKRSMGLRASRTISNTIIYVILIVMSVVWLIPFFCIVLQSFRIESTWQVGYVIPRQWGWDNYRALWNSDFKRWYLNTFIIALAVAALQTIIVLCMSYTLSRFRFKMRDGLMRFMLILGMFPGMLTMIILYRVLKDLGLTQANAVPGLILVYVASSGMGYYVSKGFFDTIPKSLDEAARVDGATRAQVLYKIILPLAKPIVIYTTDRVHGSLGRLRVRQVRLLRHLGRHERGRRYVELAAAGYDRPEVHDVLCRRRDRRHPGHDPLHVPAEVLCRRRHRRRRQGLKPTM